jgi:mannosyltransferase
MFRRSTARVQLLLVPFLATITSFVLSGRRSIWSDEAATIYRINLSWKLFFHASIYKDDVVHATYYAILKIAHFALGSDLFRLRMFSGLCIGFALYGIGKLTLLFFDKNHALLVQIILFLLPSTLDYGTDARSYALSFATDTWLCFLFFRIYQRAQESKSYGWLITGFIFLDVITSQIFIYNILIGFVLIVFLLRKRKTSLSKIFLLAHGLAVASTIPLLVIASIQISQIGWITRGFFQAWGDALSVAFASKSWVMAILGTLIFTVVTIYLARRRSLLSEPHRDLMFWAISMISFPAGFLIVASLLHPIFTQRYVFPFTSGVALLLGLAYMGLQKVGRIALASLLIPVCLLATAFNFQTSGRDYWGAKVSIIQKHSRPDAAVMASGRFYEEVLIVQPIRNVSVLRFPNSPKLPTGVKLPKTVTLESRPSQIFVIPLTKVHPADISLLEANGYSLTNSYRVGPGAILEFNRN